MEQKPTSQLPKAWHQHDGTNTMAPTPLELMANFYRRVLDGQSRTAALRDAQMDVKARYPHPLYWGAFICEGYPGPLSAPAGEKGTR